MQLRRQPFGEWILVYFDKTKISEEKLLSLTKQRGCKRAVVIKGKVKKLRNSSVRLVNLYICSGDAVALEINSDGKDKISLELPEGWKGEVPAKISGTATVFLSTPPNVKYGEYKIKVISGSASENVSCHVVRKIN